MKKVISLLVAIIMVISVVPVISADTLSQGRFTVTGDIGAGKGTIDLDISLPAEKINISGIEIELIIPSGVAFSGDATTPMDSTSWKVEQSAPYKVAGRYAKKLVVYSGESTIPTKSTSVTIFNIPISFPKTIAPGKQQVTVNLIDVAVNAPDGGSAFSGLDYFEKDEDGKHTYTDTYRYDKSIKSATVTGITDQAYTGTRRTPSPTVKLDGKTLVANTDYTVTYSNNTKCGLATVLIKGKDNYIDSITKTFYIVPKAISNISFGKDSYVGKVEVEWESDSNADGYYIHRSIKKDSGYSVIKTISGSKTDNYTDTGLLSGTRYYYKVQAYKTIGGKKISGILTSATSYRSTAGYTVKATSGLKVTGKTSNSVTLKWSKGTATGAGQTVDVSGYYIYRSTSSSSGFSRIATISGASKVTYKDTGLAANKKYYYRVTPYRDYKGNAGIGQYASTNATTLKNVSKPAKLKLSSNTTSSIKISWSKVSNASGYYIYRSTSKSSGYKKVKTITKNSTVSFTNKKLSAGKTYYYRVEAYRTSSGNTATSEYAGITTCTKPKAPKISLKKATKTSIKITSKKVTGASGYQVYYSTKKKSGYKKAYTGSKKSYTKKSLKRGKKYYVKVRAYKKIGSKKYYGSYSSIKTIKL